MPAVEYSRRAEKELADILSFTKQQWGTAQADSYFQELANTFTLLARYSQMGRAFSTARRNWRRFEHASHIIIYQPIPAGIRIVRLLHKHQLVKPT